MADLTSTDVIIKSDIKRYKKNSKASWITYLAIVFLCLYFLILYANRVGNRVAEFTDGKVLGSNQVYSYIFGVDVILNLCILLFGFYTGVKVGGYSKAFAYVAYVLAAIQIARIFIIPLSYLDAMTNLNSTMLNSYDFTWLVVMLAASAACFIIGGVWGQIGAIEKENFQKALDEGEVDLEAALKDENDSLTKDETPVDIFDEDLDGKKETASESDVEISSETTNLGGDV
ncbi:MAG: hypothetical protein LUD29_01050 [Clostridia bacterium]|nr:hypothetical protein [Clostridia bacterium]